MCTGTQRKNSDFIGSWPDLPVGLGGSPDEAGVGCGSLWGPEHWLWRYWRIFIGMSSPGGHNFDTKSWHDPTACWLQCWDASGQTTKRAGTQPHPSADRLPKAFWSPQVPLNTPLDTPLPTRGTRPSSTHQETCTSLLDHGCHPTGGRHQKQEVLLYCSQHNRNRKHRKLDNIKCTNILGQHVGWNNTLGQH